MDFCMKSLSAECEVNQQEGTEEFKCYMMWQMMMDMLHSKGQLCHGRMETQRNDIKNVLCSRRLMTVVSVTYSVWANV